MMARRQLLIATPALLVASVGGDPGTGRAPYRRGGLAPARLDQGYRPPFPAAVPPGRGNVVRARQIIISGPNEGLFEYLGNPVLGNSPILWATAPGTATDPPGNALEVSGGLAVARRAGNVIQQLIWLDPSTGTLYLGSSQRTATYRMAGITVQNSLSNELDIVSAFDTVAAPVNVGVRMISGPVSNAGQFLIASPAGANAIGLALAELAVGGGGFPQTLALGIGIPVTDTVYRWVIDRNGKMQWGPGGAAAVDTDLFRAGVGTLKTDNEFQTAQVFTAVPVGVQIVFRAFELADTNNRWQVDTTGRISWGPGNAATDVELYRAGAGIIQTDHQYRVNAGSAGVAAVTVGVTGDTNERLTVDSNGKHSWGTGAAAADTQLFRLSAARLGTSDQGQATNYVVPANQPADFTAFSATTAALTQMSKAWVIPSGDAAVGAHYRVTARGTGTNGTTADKLQVEASFGGAQANTLITVPTTVIGINASFAWKITLDAYCVTTGAAATWWLSAEVSVYAGAADTEFTATNMGAATITVASNAAITFEALAGWNAITGGPNANSALSTFERLS